MLKKNVKQTKANTENEKQIAAIKKDLKDGKSKLKIKTQKMIKMTLKKMEKTAGKQIKKLLKSK
ncbi:MAG: hypothetical protein WBP08_09755 [Saprospiraceae bacterium]|jgi:hypothetical protein|nr:hypothetical protein [Saprospiraceae bacterium]